MSLLELLGLAGSIIVTILLFAVLAIALDSILRRVIR